MQHEWWWGEDIQKSHFIQLRVWSFLGMEKCNIKILVIDIELCFLREHCQGWKVLRKGSDGRSLIMRIQDLEGGLGKSLWPMAMWVANEKRVEKRDMKFELKRNINIKKELSASWWHQPYSTGAEEVLVWVNDMGNFLSLKMLTPYLSFF